MTYRVGTIFKRTSGAGYYILSLVFCGKNGNRYCFTSLKDGNRWRDAQLLSPSDNNACTPFIPDDSPFWGISGRGGWEIVENAVVDIKHKGILLNKEERYLCRSGKKIQALKKLRERTGVGLIEAKRIVEQFINEEARKR